MTSATPGSAPLAAPYAGLRVVELARDPAGELTGKLLAELGADVVKVEPPEGSPTRQIGPFAGDLPDPERSLTFWYYNTSKRGVTLDYRAPEGMRRLRGLLAGADIFVCTLQPAELQALSLDLDELVQSNPRLIVLSVTPFGLNGPWADYQTSDLVALAAGGPLHTCGYDDLTIPPIRPGGNQAYHTAASFAHTSLLLALLDRQRTGRGQVVDVSMHESLAVTVELANPYWMYQQTLVRRQTCRHAQPVLTHQTIYPCGDGRWVYFVLIVAELKPWQALVEWLESKGLAVDLTDEAYLEADYRRQQYPHIQEVVESFALLSDAETFYREGQARGLPVGILYAPEDLPHDRHLLAREFFVTAEHEDLGPVTYPGAPYRFSSVRWQLRRRAPHLGEHNAELLAAPSAGVSIAG